jgi:hypothetical protein
VDLDRPTAVPVSRQTFIRGVTGGAAAAISSGLWAGQSPAAGASPERSVGSRGRRASVAVDLTHVTGKVVEPYLYGYATGGLLYNDFQLAANGFAERSAEKLSPALIRFNTSVTTLIQSVFAHGVSRPDWAPFANWVQHSADFLRKGGRLVFGIGPSGDDTSIPPATWAEYAKATAQHFREIGQEITYWEAGSQCDPMGAVKYSTYFNAIADALHSVNRTYLVGGPVASWSGGIDLPTFVRHSGSRIGFIDFHSYPVSDTDSTQEAYAKAVTFPDVMSARQAVAGTVAASLPIGLLEYNMNGAQQTNGTYGLPAQGTIVGAVYIALLLTRAFTSTTNFTMGGLWDIVGDSNYGVIGNAQDKTNFNTIDEQGWYLRQAANIMPGHQVRATTSAPDLQILATRSGRRFSVQLVNYNLTEEQPVTVTVKGALPGGSVARWELSTRYPHGQSAKNASLAPLLVPPQSIVILSGERS